MTPRRLAAHIRKFVTLIVQCTPCRTHGRALRDPEPIRTLHAAFGTDADTTGWLVLNRLARFRPSDRSGDARALPSMARSYASTTGPRRRRAPTMATIEGGCRRSCHIDLLQRITAHILLPAGPIRLRHGDN